MSLYHDGSMGYVQLNLTEHDARSLWCSAKTNLTERMTQPKFRCLLREELHRRYISPLNFSLRTHNPLPLRLAVLSLPTTSKHHYFAMQFTNAFFALASALLLIVPASAATLKADIACTPCTFDLISIIVCQTARLTFSNAQWRPATATTITMSVIRASTISAPAREASSKAVSYSTILLERPGQHH